jgi:hypothetical protein
MAMVIGKRPPVLGVIYDDEAAAHEGDSGFTVLFDDAPNQSELRVGVHGYDDPRVTTWCLHCLIDEHPEVGRGLDLAKEHGTVDLDVETGEWHPG